jgi:predicted MFS family arabinose efflux permease
MNEAVQRTNWLAIAVLFCAGLLAAMQFAKMAPIMPVVASDLNLTPIVAGLTVSILGLVGVVFAIAVGAVVNAIGLWRGMRLAMLAGAAVALLGALAPGSGFFLLSRFCEGFSHLLIVVCAPALMAGFATAEDKPIALALWGCFFGLGFAIVSLVQQPVVTAFGWRGFLVVHGLAMLAIAAAIHGLAPRQTDVGRPIAVPSLRAIAFTHLKVFRSGAPLLLALVFCAYTILFLAVLTFLTGFLNADMAWPADQVGRFLAFASVTTLCFTLLAGVVLRWGVTALQGYTISFAGLAAAALVVFVLQPGRVPMMAAILVMMAAFGLLPGLTFASMPRVAETPERAALGYSAIALFGNAGTFLGTPIFAALKQTTGWAGIALFIVATCAAGIGIAAVLSRSINSEVRHG